MASTSGIDGLSSGAAYSVAPGERSPPIGQTANDGQDNTAKVSSAGNPSSSTKLSAEALEIVRQLQARDNQVRQHEQAHLAASGGLAVSGPIYTYQKGPDGVSYAIGGEVNIDVSPGSTPAETIARAETIQAAALAPADPSGQDRAVAAEAQRMEQQARTELQLQKKEGQTPQTPEKHNDVAKLYRAIESAGNASGGISEYA